MEKEYDGIRNFSVAAVKRGDELRFLHKICEGGTDDSYGIEVAKLAGLPQKVINRAKEELVELENSEGQSFPRPSKRLRIISSASPR